METKSNQTMTRTKPDRPTVTVGTFPGPGTLRERGMAEVATECRARERTAVRNGRLADAALYGEIASRAEAVATREADLRFAKEVLPGVKAPLARTAEEDTRHLAGLVRRQRVVDWLLILAAVVTAMMFTGCAATEGTGTIHGRVGTFSPTGRGDVDIGDLGPVPTAGVGGTIGAPDVLTGAVGEWFMEVSDLSGGLEVEDVGLYLDSQAYRFGVGLRSETRRYLGLDLSIGAGAVLSVVEGQVSSPDGRLDVSEGGLGGYVSGEAARGPFFLEIRYDLGPEVDFHDEDVELGGLSLMGGLRWVL